MLVYFMVIWNIYGHLGNFMTIWYILCSFGTFFQPWYHAPSKICLPCGHQYASRQKYVAPINRQVFDQKRRKEVMLKNWFSVCRNPKIRNTIKEATWPIASDFRQKNFSKSKEQRCCKIDVIKYIMKKLLWCCVRMSMDKLPTVKISTWLKVFMYYNVT
jgi:hypothetical protein